MGFSFKYCRLDFTYLWEFELANGIGDPHQLEPLFSRVSDNIGHVLHDLAETIPQFRTKCQKKSPLKT